MVIYTVKSGDTILSIAEEYGVSANRLISDNALIEPANLAIGQALLILFPSITHTIRAGETMNSIAYTYNTSVIKLIQNNPTLINEQTLEEGSVIVISYENKPTKNAMVSGFAYEFINEVIYESALPYLTYAIHFGYGFDEDGEIITINDENLINLAHSYQTGVLLSLTTINRDGTFGGGKVEKLLTDIDFQNKVIHGMIFQIQNKNVQGLDIDMEYIEPQFRVEFAEFVGNCTNQLNEYGYITHVDLAPKTSPEQAGLLYESHDYFLLGNSADYVFLMTYEWGYTFGPPMAIAPINNVRKVLEYALTEIPANKIFLGIPNYAYDWKLPFEKGITAAVTMNNVSAVRLAVYEGSEIFFDEQSQSPYFNYTSEFDGSEHIVWFEDVRSMQAKYNLVIEKDILGCGYWNLMNPFPQNYLLLNSMVNIMKLY